MTEKELTVEQLKKAFGGCEKCYGKGYSTQTIDGGTKVNTCVCDRGKQIDKLLAEMQKGVLNNFVIEMEENLPEYIEETYPKGKKNSKDRGPATVHIALFLKEVRKAINTSK